jgi:hypothetical protein
VNVDDSIEGPELPAEDALSKLLACEDPSGSAQENLQQRKLHASQIHWCVVQPNFARCGIEVEIACNQWPCGYGNLGGPAQNGANSGKKLARVEWLGQVVVRSDLKPKDPFDIFSARGQDQHRNGRLRTQSA